MGITRTRAALAAVALVGLLSACKPASTGASPGGYCYVVIIANDPTITTDDGQTEPVCFHSKATLYRAERAAGLQSPPPR